MYIMQNSHVNTFFKKKKPKTSLYYKGTSFPKYWINELSL